MKKKIAKHLCEPTAANNNSVVPSSLTCPYCRYRNNCFNDTPGL